jgi:hypothetical protein
MYYLELHIHGHFKKALDDGHVGPKYVVPLIHITLSHNKRVSTKLFNRFIYTKKPTNK